MNPLRVANTTLFLPFGQESFEHWLQWIASPSLTVDALPQNLHAGTGGFQVAAVR